MMKHTKYLATKSINGFFVIFLIHFFFSAQVFSQNIPKVSISGSFWDDNTGIDLKTIIYGLKAGEKTKIAETNAKNLFNFELATDVQELVFESPGYNSVSIPIHLVGKFEMQSTASISINSKGGFAQFQYKDVLIFGLPFTYQKGIKYELMTVTNDSLFKNSDFSFLIEKKASTAYPLTEKSLQSNFKVIISNLSNQIIQEIDLNANKGITLVDINIYPKTKEIELPNKENSKDSGVAILDIIKKADQNIQLPYAYLGSRTLYFDQSKFELKSENRLILDTLAIYLQQKMNARINVAGYTDNIGDETLNATLAKYRAQVVANYLKNKGVNAGQMDLKWQNNNTDEKQIKEDLSKFRKVVIEEIN